MFVLNAPTADKSSVTIRLYKNGQGGKAYKTLKMKKMGDERWGATVKGDLKGKFYTFDIGKGETPGTFAKAVGVNGNRGAIVDLYDTDPVGWDKDVRPAIQSPADLVIYELHVRDFSISPTSGLKYQGKYLALVYVNGNILVCVYRVKRFGYVFKFYIRVCHITSLKIAICLFKTSQIFRCFKKTNRAAAMDCSYCL